MGLRARATWEAIASFTPSDLFTESTKRELLGDSVTEVAAPTLYCGDPQN